MAKAISAEVEGIKELEDTFKSYMRKVSTRYRAITVAGAATVAAEMVSKIGGRKKSGRLYRLTGGRLHRASAPGQSPANRTGTLLKSIGIKLKFAQGGEVSSVTVGVHADAGKAFRYAHFLEFGTRRMARRVFIRTSLLKHRKRILAQYEKALAA